MERILLKIADGDKQALYPERKVMAWLLGIVCYLALLLTGILFLRSGTLAEKRISPLQNAKCEPEDQQPAAASPESHLYSGDYQRASGDVDS